MECAQVGFKERQDARVEHQWFDHSKGMHLSVSTISVTVMNNLGWWDVEAREVIRNVICKRGKEAEGSPSPKFIIDPNERLRRVLGVYVPLDDGQLISPKSSDRIPELHTYYSF